MYVVIDEISNLDGGGLYVLARLWNSQADYLASAPPVTESFAWPNLQPIARRYVTDGQGRRQAEDDTWHDVREMTPEEEDAIKWKWEDYQIDRIALVEQSLRRYWVLRQRADADGRPWPKDHADRRMRRTNEDPRGLRNSQLEAKRGVGFEVHP